MSETERKPFAVMPWMASPSAVVTTVTPVAKRPITCRSARPASAVARAAGVSLATPAGPFGVTGVAFPGSLRGRGGGISPASPVRPDTAVRLATPTRVPSGGAPSLR